MNRQRVASKLLCYRQRLKELLFGQQILSANGKIVAEHQFISPTLIKLKSRSAVFH